MSGVSYIQPPEAGPVLGLYSHLSMVPSGTHLAFVAGQVGADLDGNCVGDDFELQMRRAFTNIGLVLKAVGAQLCDVAKFTTYLTVPENIASFYEVRAALFPSLYPSRSYPPNTLLVIQRLVRPEFLIEIEAIAIVPASGPTHEVA